MPYEGLLPLYELSRKAVTVTFHDLGAGSASRLCGVLTSEKVGNSLLIRRVEVIPWSEIPLSLGNWSFPKQVSAYEAWMNRFFSLGKAKIAPQDIYEIFNKPQARSLLTGHVLARVFTPLVFQEPRNVRPDLKEMGRRGFKFSLVSSEVTLTEFTAQNYRLLTEWLETSPVQVLAFMEGSQAITIRNRLQSAREQGFLEKPGSGKRSAKKS